MHLETADETFMDASTHGRDVYKRQGLNHLIYEIVDNSVDEHLAGACDTIRVTLEKNGSCTVEDNGQMCIRDSTYGAEKGLF